MGCFRVVLQLFRACKNVDPEALVSRIRSRRISLNDLCGEVHKSGVLSAAQIAEVKQHD